MVTPMSESLPFISIIVPVYNVEEYIHDCLDSLVIQDYPNYEIILIDDGSPDHCGEICDAYAKKDKRIRVIHQKNAGVSMARNAALRIASGEYVAFVDSDDWVDSDYLSLLAEHMTPGGMCACRFIREDVTAKAVLSSEHPARKKLTVQMNREEAEFSVIAGSSRLDGMAGYIGTKIFDKKIINQYDLKFQQDLVLWEDHLFDIQYLSHTTGIITYINEMAYHYRSNPQSATGSEYSKVSRSDNYVFSPVYVLEQELDLIEQTPVLQNLLEERILYEKTRVILKLEILCREDHPLFLDYLKYVRKNCKKYLLGEKIYLTMKSMIHIISCCISPRLYHFEWKFIGYIKGEKRA